MREKKDVMFKAGKTYTKDEFDCMNLVERTKMRRADPEQYEKLQRDEMKSAFDKTADGGNSFKTWEKERQNRG